MLVVITKNGLITKFDESTIRCMSRGCKGVLGMKIMQGDEVAAMIALPEKQSNKEEATPPEPEMEGENGETENN